LLPDGAEILSEQSVTLTVVDQDLEAPEFTSAVSVAIDENSGADQAVYVATVKNHRHTVLLYLIAVIQRLQLMLLQVLLR
jgi:hypothetical protein